MKTLYSLIALAILSVFLLLPSQSLAGWVNGYYRSDGTWVNGYWRTEPNYYKWDNYSWDGDWSDALNDKSWYRDYGYDPEPWDNEYPNYSYWDSLPSYSSSYSNSWSNDWNDWSYNSYDTYNYSSYDYNYPSYSSSWDWYDDSSSLGDSYYTGGSYDYDSYSDWLDW